MIRTEKNSIKIWKIIFGIYLLILLKLIVFKYPWQSLAEIAKNWEKDVILQGVSSGNFILGKSIRLYIRYFHKFSFWNGFANLVGNVLVFIPYGFLLPKTYPSCGKWWRAVYCAVGFAMSIELFQLVSGFGRFDVDDILLNCLGAVCGYLIYVFCHRRRQRKGKDY